MVKKLGVDIVEISRLRKILKDKKNSFLNKVFTKEEKKYAFSHKDKASHLASIFAGKEAVSKALGVDKYPFIEVEIRHMKSGEPVAYCRGKKLPIKISISHGGEMVIAVAVA